MQNNLLSRVFGGFLERRIPGKSLRRYTFFLLLHALHGSQLKAQFWPLWELEGPRADVLAMLLKGGSRPWVTYKPRQMDPQKPTRKSAVSFPKRGDLLA